MSDRPDVDTGKLPAVDPVEMKTAPFIVALLAPVIGVSKRWPRLLHAIEMDEAVTWSLHNRTATAACGASRLRVMGDEDGRVVPWPPAAKPMPTGMERCRECWNLTGRKRPRARWGKREVA